MQMYINYRNSSVVERFPLKEAVNGSNPFRDARVHQNSRLQASSRKVERFNMSKVAWWKVARLLAVTGKILVIELGFSFPVGLVRLPVVGGLSFERRFT